MTHAEGLFFPPLFFRLSYLSKFHSSPVLRIWLYLDCLPFLQSLHHLFALDAAAACGHWPNENRAFISPGGPFCGQITLDTNIPTFDSCPPAAIASKSERKNPTVSSLPSPRFPYGRRATTWEQLPRFRPLVAPVSSSAPGEEDCPELIPALIIFKAAGIYIALTQAPVARQLPRDAAFPSFRRWAEIATTDFSRRHRSIWPAGCSWTLSKCEFFSF